VAQTKPITARFELNTDHGGSAEQGTVAPCRSNRKSSLELPTTARIASMTHPNQNSALVDREQQRALLSTLMAMAAMASSTSGGAVDGWSNEQGA